MIAGRYQSINPKEVIHFREKQIAQEKERRPKYGMGTHVPGNKHPGQYRGGHKYKNANMPAAHSRGGHKYSHANMPAAHGG